MAESESDEKLIRKLSKSSRENVILNLSKAAQSFIAGSSGGIVSTLILHPLDLLKIRFAVNNGKAIKDRPKYFGLKHAFKTVISQEGFKGLYKGSKPCGIYKFLGAVLFVL
jgi:hypothetical protein